MGMSAADMQAVDELKVEQAKEAAVQRAAAAKAEQAAAKIAALKAKQAEVRRQLGKGGRGRGGGGGGASGGASGDAAWEQQSQTSANKAPNGKQQGIVKMWNATKGFGFIDVVGMDKDVFCHMSKLAPGVKAQHLRPGTMVELDVKKGRKGMEATSLTLVEEL